MKTGRDENSSRYRYRIMLVVTAVVTMFPLACNYIMEGGAISDWMIRIQELSAGFRLFPSTEAYLAMGSRESGMASNLWFIPAGILYRISGSFVLAYRVYMLALQAATLIFAKMFFERLFADAGSKIPVYFGVLLYMTCPYRIFVCYDQADLSQAAAWMVLPLYAWAAAGILQGKKKAWNVAVAAFALAGAGYAEGICFFLLSGFTVLAAFFFQKVSPVIAIGAGAVLFCPGLYRLGQYLSTGSCGGLVLPVHTIMQYGYRLGQFFSSYAFRDSHPGMGLGMFLCLLAGLNAAFLGDDGKMGKREKFFVWSGILFLLVAWRRFPWDLGQRMGTWALRLISLINTPAVFAGAAYGCLCIPSASAVGRISGRGNKQIALAVQIMVVLACLGLCIYQCNMLTYSRLPMNVR